MVFIVALMLASAIMTKDKITATPGMTITSLSDLYDDTTRAKEDIEAMQDAGLIDEHGKMVDLDLRVNGERVELAALTTRIANGEDVGEITVNGNVATAEQVMKISQVSAAIEIAELLDEEITVTDEHVTNLEALLAGIQNGTIDLETTLNTGVLHLSGNTAKGTTLLGNGNEDTTDYTLVENTPATLTVSEDGKYYYAPYVSGSTYIKNYAFELYPGVEDKEQYITDEYTSGTNPQPNAATTEGNIRVDGFDWEKAIVGVDDNPGAPTVTVVIPFKTDDPDNAIQNWIASDADAGKLVDITENGIGIEMDLPIYGAVNLKYYFGYMFFSYSKEGAYATGQGYGAAVRFPVYLVEQVVDGLERVVAVATRFAAHTNRDHHVRRDTLSLYVDRDGSLTWDTSVVTSWTGGARNDGVVSHLPAWSEAQTDALGYRYWSSLSYSWNKGGHYSSDGYTWIENDYEDRRVGGVDNYRTAPKIPGRCLHYYVPSAYTMTNDEYKIREEGSWEPAENGFIRLLNPENPEFPYVYPANPGYPERQYDIEYMVTEDFYNAFAHASASSKYYVSFDSLNEDLVFENSSIDYPWHVETDGDRTYAAAGKCEPDYWNYSQSILKLTVTLEKPGTLSFDYHYKTSYNKYDRINDCFYLQVYPAPSAAEGSSLVFSKYGDGQTWQTYTLELSAGTHTISWEYINQQQTSNDSADDHVYIDNVVIITDGTVTQRETEWIPDGYFPMESISDSLHFYYDPDRTWETVTEGDRDYARSGNLLNKDWNGTYSQLYLHVYLKREGKISFDYKCVTDDTGNYGTFSVASDGKGGDAVLTVNENTPSWQHFSYDLPQGYYTITWQFYNTKDESDTECYFAIDNVEVTSDMEVAEVPPIWLAKVNQGAEDLKVALRISDRLDFARGANGRLFENLEWLPDTDGEHFVWEDLSTDDLYVAALIPTNMHVPEIVFTHTNQINNTILVHGSEFFSPSNQMSYNLPIYLQVCEAAPYLNVPKSSQIRQALVGYDADVMFSSNLAQHNKLAGGTTYHVELYKIGGINRDDLNTLPANAQRIDVPGWGVFSASADNALSHITVPGAVLEGEGAYAVTISAEFSDGDKMQTFYAIAYLDVKQIPAKITLGDLASAYVDTEHIPTITYTIENASANVEVKYTVQGSGEAVGPMTEATGGVIPFAPDAFEGLRKAYTITVYARNTAGDAWSVDSLLLTVYNNDVLELLIKDVALGEIGGSTGGKPGDGTEVASGTINIDNNPKIADLVDEDGEGAGITISNYDFDTLRSDIGLQRVISVNYGSGVWGVISDRMQWSYKEADGSTSDAVTINHKENGSYSDLRNYSYTSYIPTTNFLIVATDDRTADAPVTITAVHALTGTTRSINVTVNTLKNKLVLFRFLPKTTTYVTYTNGKGVTRELHSDENGELIVYEPDGIVSEVVAMAEYDGETYVGTIQHRYLVSGEKNITKLEIYPCNNLVLAPISNQTLTILKPDGKPYTGTATLRTGIYKGGEYCPTFGVRTVKGEGGQIIRDDVVVSVNNGKITLYYDPTQLTADDGLKRGLTYVYEYRIEGYQPGYILVDPLSDDPSDAIINLQKVRGNATAPQIIRQEYQQYLNGTQPTSYTRNVIDSTVNIGISPNFPKAVLYTDIALPGETVGVGEDMYGTRGYSTYVGANVVKFAFYTTDGKKLTGQSDLLGDNVQATQITNLEQLSNATCYVFPFSAVPMLRSTYVMTDADMRTDGIDDTAKTPTARVKAVFTRGGLTIANINMPFGITNVSNQPDLTNKDNGVETIGKEVRDTLRETTDIGSIFRSINVNDMIKKGFVFLGNMSGEGGDNPISLMILPTQDPAVFRIIALVGENGREDDDDGDGVSVNYNPDDLAEDYNKLMKELEDSGKKKDSDDNGEGKMEFNFYGTIILEARIGIEDGKWDIAFRGGNVGTNVKGSYEWGQTFMCGPYPAFISFEAGFHADLEVAFGNKGTARAMLLDAALGVSIEAFAGLGFDLSLVAIQLGIYGSIGADVNFLLLTPSDGAVSTGTKLTISGEIGIKLKVKILFISYSKKFASTGFNWTKKWNNYDQIQNYWTDQGYGEMFGVTRKGRKYSMLLFADGSAVVAIDGGAELESRDYLELEERVWMSGTTEGRRLLKSAGLLTDVQTNAYPYANPVFTDDGEMFLYISDNDNAAKAEGVASFAIKNGDGYDNMGRIDTSEGNILADLDVVASGTKDNAFAAWAKQIEMPKMEKGADVTNDDLGMMFNATEVYAAIYNGTAWTTTRLTDNFVADMSPVVASYGDRAIVAWRSMYASSMTASNDITAAFDVENNINYRIYNGTEWTTVQVAYNGSAGSVNALDSAMLPDGTAILTYTVRTGDDVTTTETFYTVINADGSVLTTGRLTNDSYTDSNAQVTAVNEDGGYFVIGWYSEHDAGEGSTAEYDDNGNATKKAVVAHDIRLARINANGSYALDFPESIGGTGNTGITSDFRFSSPVNNTNLTNVSIVWSERKDSDQAEDAGKYQLNAVRFFKADNLIGVTAPTNIAETAKNYTIDHFDVYTDSEGAVHAVILGSDYDTIEGISVYDSIDLNAAAGNTVNSNTDAPNNLDILDGEAISSIKLAKGTFPEIAADVIAETNIDEVIPGLTTPVQFTVTNTGTGTLTTVTATVGLDSKDFTVNLLPSQSATLIMTYSVPAGAVRDVDYSVTTNGTELGSGTLTLNRPDVGISEVKIIREENGERDVLVRLNNDSKIPLAGSEKTVKLAFYKDALHKNVIGEGISISAENYADIDKGIYTIVHTIAVSDLYTGGGEIPDAGLTIYVRAWVDETEEPTTSNNNSFVYFQGLVTRNNGAKLTTDTSLEENDGSYTVSAEIRNNSMLDVNAGIPVAVLLDGNGNIVAQKNFQDAELFIGKESRKDGLSVTFTAGEIDGTPVQADVRYLYKVSFDVNGGTGEFADVTTDIDGHITLPEGQPTPSQNVPTLFFRGWYSSPTGGELITGNTLFNNHATVYARYTPHQHVFECIENNGDTVTVKCVSTAEDDCPLEGIERTVTLTIVAPERVATGYGMPNATITGEIDKYSMPEICYYTATAVGERGEALTSAPVDAGKYWAEFTLNDGGSGITAYVVYEIPYIEGVIANNVQVPNFVKVTDPVALNDLTACSAVEAYAWIAANADTLQSGDPRAEKIVVYGKQYMVRPDDVPEEYWGYDDNTEYAMCFVYNMWSGWEKQTLALDELTERISNAWGDVYIKGAGSTQMVAGVEFENVVSREDLTAVSCTELDAVLWILANINRYPQGMVVFAVDNENCSYIRYTAKSVTIQNTRTSWLLDESYGMPVFIARPSDVLNPYKTFTVVYNANGGTGSAGGTFYVKSHIEIADGSGFSKPNLVFNGWNTKADGTGDAYQPGDIFEVLGNTTFYAQWKHVHNWSIAYNEDTHVFTATCDVPGCPHSSLTLHPEAVDKMYDGQNAKPYTCSDNWTEVNGLPLPTVTYYVGGEKVAEAKNVGAYTAVVSLDGHDVEVSEFHITKRPIIVIADDKEIHEGEEEPDLTVSYDSVSAGLCFDNDATYPWQIVTEGDRAYVKSGNAGQGNTTSTLTLTVTLAEEGTIYFDYKYGTENNWDWCYFRVDGSEKFKQSNVRDWTTYSIDLSVGTHTLTWAYSKDGSGDRNGDFYAIDNVVIKSGGEVTTAEQENPNIAFNEALNVFEGGIVEGDTLNYTISREEGEAMGTYTITVVMGDNPNYDVQEVRTGTFTILESLGDPQTIVADDVTATYGDTGLKINAEVTVGEGTLSYAVKSGDAVTVDAEGNLTIVKAGTAVITVTASQTETYAPATKNVTVTIEKATPYYTVPTNLLATYGQTLANVTLTGGFAWTNNTLSVGDIGSRTFKVTFTPADTTNYKVVEDIDVTVTVEPKTITITGATLVSRDYAEGNVAVSVSAVTFDGAILTIDTDYTATAQMSDDTAGNKTATVTVVLQNNNYVLSQSTYAGTTVTINKVDYTGNKSANATLIGMMGKTSVVTLPTLPDGASYGIVTSDNDAFFTIGEIANGKVTLTSAKDYQETELTAKTFTVAVSGATNYNDYIVTVTITPTFKEEQTISTEATITATYGDTGLSIAANTTGDGDISYALTSGDAVTINAQTGEITIVKAGTATITVTAAETEDYAEATFDVTVTINKATPEYTAPIGLSATYGDTLNDVVLTTGWTWNAPTTNVGVVGSRAFAATFTPNDTDNYDTVELELIVTVEKATPAYTVPIGLTATYGDTLNGVVLTSGWTWNAPASSVGLVGNNQFAATFTPNDTDNYETVQDNVIVTVNAKAVTLELYVDGVIVTEATSIVYDGQEHTFVVKAIGVNDEVITIDAETQTNVFSSTEFIVDAQNLTADGSEYENYVLENDYNVPDYAIVAKAITITADDKSSVYNDAIVGLTAQITDGNGVYVLPDEDSEVFVLTKEQGVNAGEYVITVNVVGNSNYIVTPVNGKYTINKKAVTVAPDDKTITYGDNNVTLTYAITGLVGEETLTGVTLTREEGNNAGTYVITATHDDTLDGNYIVTITGTATYTIGQKAVTVAPDDKTVTYGDDEANLTYAVTGLVGEETLTGITLTREEGTNAGTYVITATHDDALDRNYAVTIANTGVYTIQKKANTINTDEIVKEYTYSGSNFTVDGATALGDGVISYENNIVKEAGNHTVIVKVAEGTNYLAAETTIDVYVKETAPVKNDESGTSTHGKIISIENAQEGTSMTEIFKNAKEDTSESKEIKAFIGSTIVVFDEVAIEEISAAEEEVELVLNVTYVEEEQAITPENFKDAEVIVRVSLSNGVTFASGKATITLDYDKEIPKGKIVKVYYVDQDGNRIDMNATFVEGKIVFETNHFSDYIVVIEDVSFDIGWISFIFGMIVLLYFAAFIVLTKVFGKNRKLLCYIGLAASAAVILAAIVIVAVMPGVISALSFGLCAVDALLFILYGTGEGTGKNGKNGGNKPTKNVKPAPAAKPASAEVAATVDGVEEGMTLKESLSLASTISEPPAAETVDKKTIGGYLHNKHAGSVVLNYRGNKTKTGLPLADTHYVVRPDGKECFLYVYEVDGTALLLAQLDESYVKDLTKAHKNVYKSAFPKSKKNWYSVVIDSTFTKADVEAVLDASYAHVKG